MTKKKGLSPQALLAAVFTLSLLSFVLAALFPSWFYYTMDIAPYLVFHNIAEFFSVMVSLAIFSMGWFTYDQSKNRNALFLACAFLAIGLIDLQHTLGYPGMPEFITQNSAEKSTQFWIAARMFAALAFLASGYVRQGSAGRFLSKGFLLAAAVAVSGVVFVGVIYFPSSLPATFVEGSGLTSYKIYAEYLIIILLILALPVYWKRYASTGKKLLLYMMAALIVCVFSELSFTVYKSAFDTYNTLGHIYKIIAFALIYWGIYVSAVKFPYLELMAETEKLLAETEERKRIETELIQQRHKLEKERQFLEAVFDNIEEGIVSCDAQGIISRFNRATREFHGLPAEPIPAEQWPDHYNLYLADGKTPMVRDDVPLFRALQGEMVRNVEMMIIPADQTTRARSLVANGQPLVSSDGTLLGAVATMHDITASKEAEQALATSEAFRRAIIDSSHDCIQVLDLAGNLLFMNLGGQRLMEIEDVERYLHKSWPDLYQNPDREVALAACEQARQGRVGTFQSACATAKGKPKWWDVVITPMVDSEGRVQRLLAISRDITESHLHQQEWQDAMAFFADGIVILDLDNRVVRGNQPFWLLTGTSPEQGVGRDITTILHPQGGEEICPCCLARSQGEDGLFTLEGDDPVNPCGYPVELMVRMIRDAKGQPLSMLMGFHDLRRQRQAEEELRHHRDHLEELVALRTAELVQKNKDLRQMNKQFVGRELRMIELKKEIARLSKTNIE